MSASPQSSTLQGFYGWTDTLKGVFYGPGSVTTALPKLLESLGAKKALVVTGKSLHTKVRSSVDRSGQITLKLVALSTD
jgi:hypothetical protein